MSARLGILAGKWRVLKPLGLLLAAIVVLLAVSIAKLELAPPAQPEQLVLDPQERLRSEEVLFRETRPKESYSQGGFRPVVVYEVALRKRDDRFSRPYTLNFFAARDPNLAIARKDKEGWIKLDGAMPGKHASVALSIRLDKPGIYALGVFE